MSAEIIAFRKREKPKDKPVVAPTSRRLEALDALRGLCVIAAILLGGVPPVASKWHGFGGRDLLLAGFLFCLGMAIPLSLAARAARQSRGRLMLHIGLRTVILVALGVVLGNVPDIELANLRLPGTLQYVGLCYGLAATLCLSFGRKSDADFTLRLWPVAAATGIALVIYAGLLVVWRGAGCAGACFDNVHSLPVVVDDALFGRNGFDPMALVAVLGALASTLLGVLTALFVRRHGIRNTMAGLAFLGILLIVAGGSLDSLLPVVAALWTPSFALVAGGLSLIAFALVGIVTEIPGVKRGAYPLRVFGGNALLAVVVATLVARVWPMTPVYAIALLVIIGLPLWGLSLRRIHLTP